MNPEEVRNVDAILDKLQGKVKTVFGKLAEKYESVIADNPRGECRPAVGSLVR